MNPNRILVIIPRYPPTHSGAGVAIERNYRLLKNKLNNISVTILTNKIENNDIQNDAIINVKRILHSASVRTPIYFLKDLINVIRYILRNDIIHFNSLSWVFSLSILFSKILGKKSIYQLHCMGYDDPESIKKSKFGSISFLFFCMVSKYLTASPAQNSALIKHGILKKNIFLIPQFINTSDYHIVSFDIFYYYISLTITLSIRDTAPITKTTFINYSISATYSQTINS